MEARNEKVYEFEKFRLETNDKTLWRENEKISIPIKAAEVLTLLIENRGQTVSKEQLMETIWQDTFVDENNLAVMISTLRKAFGETKNENRFIETIPRRGYRFVYEFEEMQSDLVLEKQTITEITFEKRNKTFLEKFSEKVKKYRIALVFAGVFVIASSLAIGYLDSVRKILGLDSAQASNSKPNYAIPSFESPIKSVLVLPFKQKEPKQSEFFSKDFAEALIIRIGSRNKFNVRPFYTYFSSAERESLKLQPIVEKTNFVLDGSIDLISENKFRVFCNLLDVKNNKVIWSETFENSELINIQEKISEQTLSNMLDTLTSVEKSAIEKRRPTTYSAYDFYLKGLEKLRNRSDNQFFFQEAIKADPNFAPAYAMLAASRAFTGWKDTPQSIEAKNYLNKAFELDNTQADAFAVQGFIQIFHEFDWQGGEKSLRIALEIDPYNVNAHHWLASLLAIRRRLDEAKIEMEKALEIDPISPTLLSDLGEIYYFNYELNKATDYNNQALQINPEHYFALGRVKRFSLRENYYQYVEKEKVLEDLEKKANSFSKNSFALGYINVDPMYDFIRGEPRFQAILRKINL